MAQLRKKTHAVHEHTGQAPLERQWNCPHHSCCSLLVAGLAAPPQGIHASRPRHGSDMLLSLNPLSRLHHHRPIATAQCAETTLVTNLRLISRHKHVTASLGRPHINPSCQMLCQDYAAMNICTWTWHHAPQEGSDGASCPPPPVSHTRPQACGLRQLGPTQSTLVSCPTPFPSLSHPSSLYSIHTCMCAQHTCAPDQFAHSAAVVVAGCRLVLPSPAPASRSPARYVHSSRWKSATASLSFVPCMLFSPSLPRLYGMNLMMFSVRFW